MDADQLGVWKAFDGARLDVLLTDGTRLRGCEVLSLVPRLDSVWLVANDADYIVPLETVVEVYTAGLRDRGASSRPAPVPRYFPSPASPPDRQSSGSRCS
jgi:hypothetical protein